MALELKQLRAIVEERRAQLAELRGERDQLAHRIRVLETERTRLGQRTMPTLWERNRGFKPLELGTRVDVACPECRTIGIESQMVRDAGIVAELDPEPGFTRVTCPACLFAGVVRTR
jgi:hypothetical protein